MFDEKEFMKTSFKQREKSIPVPELKAFYKEGDPVWVIRGLVGVEVARVNDAQEKNSTLLQVATALQGNKNEKLEAFKDLFGVQGEEVPNEIVRRKEILVAGSVNPECSEELAVKMAMVYPTVFYFLTTEILRLTGLGQDPGKLPPSGKEKTSSPA